VCQRLRRTAKFLIFFGATLSEAEEGHGKIFAVRQRLWRMAKFLIFWSNYIRGGEGPWEKSLPCVKGCGARQSF